MDVDFLLDGEPFSWDPDKETANIIRRGITFTESAEVFFDDFALDAPDDEHSEGEIRATIIGQTRAGKILRVTYTERWKEGRLVSRLISSRPADKKERTTYERSKFEQSGW